MKFQRIEFSWRAAFIGLYMTPERDKVWVTILPFFLAPKRCSHIIETDCQTGRWRWKQGVSGRLSIIVPGRS
jgi:hypothetical protein